jgi:hypothetical protein
MRARYRHTNREYLVVAYRRNCAALEEQEAARGIRNEIAQRERRSGGDRRSEEGSGN